MVLRRLQCIATDYEVWTLRYLFHDLLSLGGDVSHSGENKRDHLQPKGNVEKAETRDITDFSLSAREMLWNES